MGWWLWIKRHAGSGRSGVEAASPQAVVEIIPQILKMEKDVVIKSVGAFNGSGVSKGIGKDSFKK
jgi:predicted dinucleotide-utilizing enzyme